MDFLQFRAVKYAHFLQLLLKINTGAELSEAEQAEHAYLSRNLYHIYKRDDITEGLARRGGLPRHSFDEFCTVTAKLFLQMLDHLLAGDMRGVLDGEEKVVFTVKVVDGIKNDLLAYHDEIISTPDHVWLWISGQTLLGRMYVPWLLTGRFDASFFLRTLSHELEHQVEHKRGLYNREYAMQDRIEQWMERDGNNWLGCMAPLYTIFCDTYTEGVAMFAETQHRESFSIEQPRLKTMYGTLCAIARETDAGRAEKMSDKEFTPTSQDGTYYLGRLMCYTIGLARQLHNGSIRSLSPEQRWLDNRSIGAYLRENLTVSLAGLEPDVFSDTLKELQGIRHHRQFIKAYTQACDYLGLVRPIRFLDQELFDWLKRTATAARADAVKVVAERFDSAA